MLLINKKKASDLSDVAQEITMRGGSDYFLTCSYEFHLTGSYYFGRQRRRSDIDVFTANGSAIDFLLRNGFDELPKHSYCDPMVRRVYGKDRFHVQLVDNIDAKYAVQSALKKHLPSYYDFCKSDRARIWQAFSLMVLEGITVQPQTTQVSGPKHVGGLDKCPQCGSKGFDMGGFAFYCSNSSCSNYK